MRFKADKVVAMAMAMAMAMAGMLCIAGASAEAKGKTPTVQYPKALHGVWLGGGLEYCKHPDSGDSDTRFEVTATKLTGYEHWNKPLSIVQVSKAPMAWKVVSRTYFDGASDELEEIYVLSGHQNRHLTIVNIDQSKTYDRCQ